MAKAVYSKRAVPTTARYGPRPVPGLVRTKENPTGYAFTASRISRRVSGTVEGISITTK